MDSSSVRNKFQLGQLLSSMGYVDEAQIAAALRIQQESGHSKLLGEVLVEQGFCSENQIAAALSKAYGIPYAQVSPKICDPAVIEILPREFLEENSVLPLFKVNDVLTVAVSEPSNVYLIDEIERLSCCAVQVVSATSNDINATLQTYMPAANVFVIDDIIDDDSFQDFTLIENIIDDITNLEEVAGQSPVVKLVNHLLYSAVQENASDIHIEPDDKKLRVRYRVDGRLYEKMCPPYQMHPAIVSRIKIMSDMDIAQRRLPQDGGIHVMMQGRTIDLRVSVMPGNFGEKVVIRVLDSRRMLASLESLGFSYDNLKLFKEKVKTPNGIVLVTGPTGSGKNTTLYSTLMEISTQEVNICTVEDPVECNIPAINQFQVGDVVGFDFSSALRGLLRQDPDIIMIGEIRDRDTANIAVQAALTGHLVLSTLHTNDAPSAITRLIDLGVPPYLLSASLVGVLAQRLVRKICPNCKEEYSLPPNVKRLVNNLGFPMDKVYRGIGCRKCRNTGYLGRMAIHELFTPSGDVLELITKGYTDKELRKRAISEGMSTLLQDGFEKVKAGITTVEEILRVANVNDSYLS